MCRRIAKLQLVIYRGYKIAAELSRFLTTDHTDAIWIKPKTSCLESHALPIHLLSLVETPWSIPSLLTTDHTDTIWINPKTGCLESHPFPIHSESVVKK